MRLLSIIPKARRISLEEKNDLNTDDRIFCIEFPVILFLILFVAMVVLGLGMNFFEEVIEENPSLQNAMMFIFILMFGSCFIISFFASIKVVVSDGEIVEIASKNGGKVKDWALLTGLGVILLFYACIEGSKGNPKGAYPLYVLLGFIVLRAVFRMTLKPLIRSLAIMIRKKSCTYRVTAEFRRNIVNWNEKAAEDQRFGGIPEYIYCFEGQYYRIIIHDTSTLLPGDLDSPEIFIDPERPELYYRDGLFGNK